MEEGTKGLLAASVDSSAEAIISVTLDGVITSWNASAERIFGYSGAEAVGQNIRFLVPPEVEEEHITRRARQGQQIEHFETVRVAKSGRYVDIDLTVTPVRDNAGQISGASMIAQDITERLIAEAGLQGHLKNLECSNRNLQDFSRLASRDLNAALWGLSNISSFLLEDYKGKLDSDGAQVLDQLVCYKEKLDADGARQLNHLAYLRRRTDRLIGDLLYVSKMRNEKPHQRVTAPDTE